MILNEMKKKYKLHGQGRLMSNIHTPRNSFLLQRIHANTAGNKENPTMIHFNSPNLSRNKI